MAGLTQSMTLEQLEQWARERGTQFGSFDYAQPLRVCQQLVASDIKKNFSSAKDPNGKPWPRLKWRKGHPLKDKGVLASANTVRVFANGLVASNNLEYAAIHNYGGVVNVPAKQRDRPWVFKGRNGQTVFTRKVRSHSVKIPQRQFMGWGKRLVDLMEQVFADFWQRSIWG